MIVVPGCRVLLKPLTVEETDEYFKRAKALGIELIESDKRKQQIHIDKGIVLQIGPSTNKDYTEGVEVGQTIGFAKYGGKYIEDPDTKETFLIINDDEIVCIFKD